MYVVSIHHSSSFLSTHTDQLYVSTPEPVKDHPQLFEPKQFRTAVSPNVLLLKKQAFDIKTTAISLEMRPIRQHIDNALQLL